MFVTVEGIEGAGKSTVIKFIDEFLQKNNVSHIITREPGGTEIAEEIRRIFLNHHKEIMAADTELLLVFAGRNQHLELVIRPALSEGKLVLSDRFTDASYAYQGIGRNIPFERIAVLENWVQGDLRPDLTIILDVDPEIGLARKKPNGFDRIEIEEKTFFAKIREFYLSLAKHNPDRYKVIDASQSVQKIKQQLEKLCTQYILGNKKTGNI